MNIRWAMIALVTGHVTTSFADNVNVINPTSRPVNVKQVGATTLPTGAATEAKQDTGNSSLSAVATNTAKSTLTRFRNTALTATAVAVKASAGNVHGWNFINANAVPVYVKFYNRAVHCGRGRGRGVAGDGGHRDRGGHGTCRKDSVVERLDALKVP